MVILPLYQVVFAVQEQKFSKTRFFALMHDGQIREMGMPDLRYPSYCASNGKVCGVFYDDQKGFIALSDLKITESPLPELVFTLSKHQIAYPVVSPDRQKIAFIEYGEDETSPVLRLILREEFGWFPVQLKIDAAFSPVCWGGNDALIYTGRNNELMMISASPSKRGTAKIDTNAKLPAYHQQSGRLAFVKDNNIILKGKDNLSFEADSPDMLNFSNDGESLYFTALKNGNYSLCRFSIEKREATRLCESDARIVWAAEI